MRFGWIKVHYLLLYGLVGAYLPYLPLYLRELGLSESEIGWVFGAYGPAIVFMPVLTTHLADRRLSNRLLLGVGYALSSAAIAALCQADQFEFILLIMVFFSLGATPLNRLLDGLAFAAIHDQERLGNAPPPYHRVRIWGSIGFILPSLLLFALLRYTQATSRAALMITVAIGLVAVVACAALPATTRREERSSKGFPSLQAWRILQKPPLFAFVGSLFFLFLAIHILAAFYSLLLRDVGVDDEWVGLITNVGVVLELPWILGMGRLLSGMGIRGVMVLGSVCMVVRTGLLAIAPTAATAIATQILHGPAVLCLFLVPPVYLNRHAEPGFRNSIQGLYGAVCVGSTRLLGSAVGGHVAEFGLRWAFALAAAFSLVATVWLIQGIPSDDESRNEGLPET